MEKDTAMISRHYNQLEETVSLSVSQKDTKTLTTILVSRQEGGTVEITPEPVLNAVSGQAMSPQDAEGYIIQVGKRKTGVVFLHHEVGNGVDYNGIEGVYGLGRTMVCDLNKKSESMTVLQW